MIKWERDHAIDRKFKYILLYKFTLYKFYKYNYHYYTAILKMKMNRSRMAHHSDVEKPLRKLDIYAPIKNRFCPSNNHLLNWIFTYHLLIYLLSFCGRVSLCSSIWTWTRHVMKPDLKLTQSSCLGLQSAGITDVCHYTWHQTCIYSFICLFFPQILIECFVCLSLHNADIKNWNMLSSFI